MDEATLRQNQAAEPGFSTWLSANAGSGKTRVLTDRVARLLLKGTPPQRILCLTYTKAAASEMQNRLFRRLGEWAMLPDAQLLAALTALGEEIQSPGHLLARARRLFARAIETPGGLKIQTIHAFCSSLLRRFPLEAAVSPDFGEADERSLAQLRAEVLEGFAQRADPSLQALLTRLNEEAFGKLIDDIGRHRDVFEGADPDFHAVFNLPAGLDEAALTARVFQGDEADLFAALRPVLRAGTVTDIKLGNNLPFGAPGFDDLPRLEGCLLYGKTAAAPFGARIGKLGTKNTVAALPPGVIDGLHDLAQRVADARPQRLALASLRAAKALRHFARRWLPAFDAAKARRGWLDFDDLIRLARRLLSSSDVAQWVLFKLDGGIDHILVDEAQDTSPDQWQVIRQLTQEFTAGQGARDTARTIFVVGDRKQSIYSFQGADLHGFEQSGAWFQARLESVGQALNQLELKHSFRSSDAVLRLVDQCFAPAMGASGLGGAPEHLAFHPAMPGRVDLWPTIAKPHKGDPQPWEDPLDRPSDQHPDLILARAIAAEIRATIDRGERIPGKDGPRPIHAGDFLILVRRRDVLFNSLIRACKVEGLEIAGADRLILRRELAVQDLIALLAFLALPEDDLSLAVALRSPLFGWSEDRLFRLAQPRGKAYLWEALRADPAAAETRAVLDDLRGQVDFLRPHDLIERALTRHDGRRRIRARFGAEVEDAIEAFVDLALLYEQGHVPSLDGFLGWLAASDAEVKRQSEAAGRRIRVMTVHGAKGLEAPIVILPDTAARKPPPPPPVVLVSGVPILRAGADEATEAQQAADAALAELRDAENDRLLYVALTRAEHWLIVAGAGDTEAAGSWYQRVAASMAALGAISLACPTGPGQRHQHGHWPEPVAAAAAIAAPSPRVVLVPVAPHVRVPDITSPSQLGGAKALPGDGADTETALNRGRLIHALFERLPEAPPERRDALGRQILFDLGAEAADISICLDEAQRCLSAPELAPIFNAAGLSEVALAGDWQGRRLWGVIDRLIVTPDSVLAVDFKSNRTVPQVATAVPEGLLRQMGAYAHILARIYPGRRVETALIWTSEARLMPLDPVAVAAALARAALDPVGAPS